MRRYQRPISISLPHAWRLRIIARRDTEVFRKADNSLARYSSEYKFSTWLYRIAHNAAIDHMRRNSVNSQSLETESEDGAYQLQLESSGPTPEQDHQRSEWRAEIDTVIKRLPGPYRELIVLRHSQDMSYDEIAEVTGLPLGTVKNHLSRAREMMREIFVERGFTGIYEN